MSFSWLNSLEKQNITISPNPFTDQLVLKGEVQYDDIRISNLWGQNVKGNLTIDAQSDMIVIKTVQFAHGTYFVQTNKRMFKIVKL